jgi:hypothetical protein
MVELALILPVVMLIILGAVDFGRVFLGWVELHSMVRVGAGYAAENPKAWSTVNPNAAVQDEYVRRMTAEAGGINCTLPAPLPDPAFPLGPDGANAIGDPVTVKVTCNFGLITPFLGTVLGNNIPIAASAAFPIRNGTITGIPVDPTVPTPNPTPTPTPTATATAEPTPTPTGSVGEPTATPEPTPTPTPSPSPTPPVCTVPNLIGLNINAADGRWGVGGSGAGFSTPLVYSPLVGQGDSGRVTSQTLQAGSSELCTGTAMTVTWAK